MSVSTIWVYTDLTQPEEGHGEPTSTTLELLAKASELADTVVAIVGGSGDAVAATLGAHGASKVLATGDLSGRLPGPPLAAAMADAIAADAPDAIMFGTSYDGRDVAARLSVKLDAPVITNIVELDEADGALVGVEPVFGGTTNVTTKFTGSTPGIFLVRPKSFTAAESPSGDAATVEALAVPELGASGAAKVTNVHVEETEGPSLDDAAIVVAGGRGMGDAEKFQAVEDLAKLLGAAPGASRAIVDAGWVPYSYQVGQTGKVVKPDVYIAAGISGATQHLVGMKGAKHIIAINKDAEAPIFSVADLGIVGDVHKVLPKLIEAIQSR